MSTASLSFSYDINTIKMKFLFLWNLKFPLVSLQISNLILYSQRQCSISDVSYYLFLVNATGHWDPLRPHIGDCINDKIFAEKQAHFSGLWNFEIKQNVSVLRKFCKVFVRHFSTCETYLDPYNLEFPHHIPSWVLLRSSQ